MTHVLVVPVARPPMTAELVWQTGSDVPDRYVQWIDLDKLAEAVIPVIVDVYGPDF